MFFKGNMETWFHDSKNSSSRKELEKKGVFWCGGFWRKSLESVSPEWVGGECLPSPQTGGKGF